MNQFFLQFHPLWREFSAYSVAGVNHYNAGFFFSFNQVPISDGRQRQCTLRSFLTLLHITSNGNGTPDLLIFGPTPYSPGHMLTQPESSIDDKITIKSIESFLIQVSVHMYQPHEPPYIAHTFVLQQQVSSDRVK